jgi:hypothetical protein
MGGFECLRGMLSKRPLLVLTLAISVVVSARAVHATRKGGRVTGFEISHPRARGVLFARTSESR